LRLLKGRIKHGLLLPHSWSGCNLSLSPKINSEN
jgi:hypothetical protein